MRTRHTTEYSEYEKQAQAKQTAKTPVTQPTVSAAFRRLEPYGRDSKRWRDITTKLMEFIGLDEQPLSVVKDAGFRRLISFLEPRYAPPGRKYLTDVCGIRFVFYSVLFQWNLLIAS